MQQHNHTPFASALAISPNGDHLRRDRAALRSAGVPEVHTRRSVKDALAWLAKNPVDMVLLDADLGRTTGPRVLRMLRRRPRFRRLPVIITGADGSRDAVLRALASGCSGFLVRPYSPSRLIRQCELAARGANPGRERQAALRLAQGEAGHGRHRAAAAALEKAVDRREEADRYYAEGCEHLAGERFEQAIVAFGKAVAMYDLFAEAYIGMANAWEALGQPDKARSCMRRAADAYARASEVDRARETLAKVVRDNPRAGNPFLDLGFSLVRQGEFRAAGQVYVLAARHGSTGESAWRAATRACLFTRDPKRSARLLSEAVAEAGSGLPASSVYKRIMGEAPPSEASVARRTGGLAASGARAVNDVWAVVKYTAKAVWGGSLPPVEPMPLDLDF
jgi:CheY-like chemotaxis protein